MIPPKRTEVPHPIVTEFIGNISFAPGDREDGTYWEGSFAEIISYIANILRKDGESGALD